MLTRLALALVCCFVLAPAAEPQSQGSPPSLKMVEVFFESITSKPEGALVWVATEQEVFTDGKKGPVVKREYVIDFNKGTMSSEGETREISAYEAMLVKRQLQLISLYAGDSISWWKKRQQQEEAERSTRSRSGIARK